LKICYCEVAAFICAFKWFEVTVIDVEKVIGVVSKVPLQEIPVIIKTLQEESFILILTNVLVANGVGTAVLMSQKFRAHRGK
jgi:predicted transcriptional regulator